MSENVRNILLRALFEPEFHNQLLTKPKEALAGYTLSDAERKALLEPSADLYGMLKPASQVPSVAGRVVAEPPPTTTTITTIIVVAIVAFVTAIAASNAGGVDLEALQPLIKAIKGSTGSERMNLITTLVNELTREA